MKRLLSFVICVCFLSIMDPISMAADNELNLSDYEYYYIVLFSLTYSKHS